MQDLKLLLELVRHLVFRTRSHFLGQVSFGVSSYMGELSNMTMSGIKQDKSELSTPTRPNLSYEKRLKLAEVRHYV